ncbi:hypothetical protein JB92DRAFT_3105560 [Gautieria morchelliformis]|nr:hypothetical protein JB92DRAFT_3105560 [Gautieria morchelliformis]
MDSLEILKRFGDSCRKEHFKQDSYAGTSFLDSLGGFFSAFPAYSVTNTRLEEGYNPPNSDLAKNVLADMHFMLTCTPASTYVIVSFDRQIYTERSMPFFEALRRKLWSPSCYILVLFERRDHTWDCQSFGSAHSYERLPNADVVEEYLRFLMKDQPNGLAVSCHRQCTLLLRLSDMQLSPRIYSWSIQCTPSRFVQAEHSQTAYQHMFFTDKHSEETRAIGQGKLLVSSNASLEYLNTVHVFKYSVRGSSDVSGKCADCASVQKMCQYVSPVSVSQTSFDVNIDLT